MLGIAMAAPAWSAGVLVVAGATDSIATPIDFACDDLEVNGVLNVNGATFSNVGKVIIGSTGTLNVTNGTIQVATSWQNAGTLGGSGGTVSVVNTCGNTSTAFSGNTTFNNLVATTAGHVLSLAAGSEQTVSGQLSLNGVTLRSTGATAYLTLLPTGTQSIAGVGVSDVSASRGQHLAAPLDNVITGAAANWFRATAPVSTRPVPVNSGTGLALLGVLMLLAARWAGRRPRASARNAA